MFGMASRWGWFSRGLRTHPFPLREGPLLPCLKTVESVEFRADFPALIGELLHSVSPAFGPSFLLLQEVPAASPIHAIGDFVIMSPSLWS